MPEAEPLPIAPALPVECARTHTTITVVLPYPSGVRRPDQTICVEYAETGYTGMFLDWKVAQAAAVGTKCTIEGLTPDTSYCVRARASLRNVPTSPLSAYSPTSAAICTLTEVQGAAAQ